MSAVEPVLVPVDQEPCNIDAEQRVLAGMLTAASAIETVKALLTARDFWGDTNGVLYRAMTSLHERGEPVDVITVADDLARRGLLDAKGGVPESRISELALVQVAISNIDYHAGLVRQASIQRALIRAGHEIARLGIDRPLEGAALVEAAKASLEEATSIAEPVSTEPRLRFLDGHEFVEQDLPKNDPLVGSEGDALMMPGSLMLLAGIGGAGKTTLALHALAHWAAGLPWFSIRTGRPLRIVVIENEGPHDPYVKKVKDFAGRFNQCVCSGDAHGGGDDFLHNLRFLDAPWGHFSWDDKTLARELLAAVHDFDADLVVANPLGRLGMKGAGSPEETRAFLDLLYEGGLGEDFAALLLHHMAKVGKNVPLVQQVSGDWGPHPDTIMVLEPAGERRSKLTFGKIRWGDQGRDPLILDWLTDPDGPVGYRLAEQKKTATDAEMLTAIDDYLALQDGPVSKRAVRSSVTGRAERIGELLEEGVASGRYKATVGHHPKFFLNAPAAQEPLLDDDHEWGTSGEFSYQ